MRKAATRDRHAAEVWGYRVLRWALALVFLYAGALKLADPRSFAVIIEAYGLVPDIFLMPLAVTLPALEVIAAIGLIMDLRGSLAAMSVLLGIFILVLGYGLYMGLDVDCGCFGPEDPEGKAYAGIRPAIYRDLLLAVGILILYAWRFWFRLAPVGVPMQRFFNLRRNKHAEIRSTVVRTGTHHDVGSHGIRAGSGQGQV